jgi:hypothetical protein
MNFGDCNMTQRIKAQGGVVTNEMAIIAGEGMGAGNSRHD